MKSAMVTKLRSAACVYFDVSPSCSDCGSVMKTLGMRFCSSIPFCGVFDIVIIDDNRTAEAYSRVARDNLIKEWRAANSSIKNIFYLGDDRGEEEKFCTFITIPVHDRRKDGPPAVQLHTVQELHQYYVVVSASRLEEFFPDALNFFTPNGIPLLLQDATRSARVGNTLDIPAFFEYLVKWGGKPEAAIFPSDGPFGLEKLTFGNFMNFFDGFSSPIADLRDYLFAYQQWAHAFQVGVLSSDLNGFHKK